MKRINSVLFIFLIIFGIVGCEKNTTEVKEETPQTIEQIIEKAKKEGKIVSIGMPDDWANWGESWKDYTKKYGVAHISDKDLSSAEEIALFKAEKDNASADIGDVGFEFVKIAVAEGVTQAYKPSNWDKIPEWAKDKDGNYAVAYTGTIAFIVDKTQVKEVPTSWEELLRSKAKIALGSVGKGTQSNASLLAVAMSKGGDEANIDEAYRYFAEIAKQGRLSSASVNIANLEKGEIEVGVLWDFNGLGYRSAINSERFAVVIPSDGSLVSGYSTIINKYAKNPNSAKLMREFIFSDKGQLNFAKGYARPIRDDITYPSDIAKKLLPKEQYKNVKPIKNFEAWTKTSSQISERWQNEVLEYKK